MIVVALTKVPPSLRGDLTKWCQEIQTGIFVGKASARVRDKLWERIIRDIGNGQATMVFNTQNEFGYQFRTSRADRQVTDFDGIPFLMKLNDASTMIQPGFSDAAKFHRARLFAQAKVTHTQENKRKDFIVLDIETTGLDVMKDNIISIGAVKQYADGQTECFSTFIQIDKKIPEKIVNLTGITDEMLSEKATTLVNALDELKQFIGSSPLIGYNLSFDDKFISMSLRKNGREEFHNQMIDLLTKVKKSDKFLDNYRLATVLHKYGITNKKPHDALSDARSTLALTMKLIENKNLIF
ncbi:type I-E CRISPR-associated endoribonuclease Cas2 [Oenococcus sicerae]|uniref:Type I-E CRISPR-associated endoribonuclease Cas2 n=1 Tax=Oenococcus sicerae TaxID=2203724 RepID=A0ABX5QP32_9LACO|nr:type I-E CRISPR-associated endoribonuclease Cas2e [Oenococcus sicerae]QAS70540.1 type I-E CRISPR-associated endoribonuclease Cas2 [Oenococcus sicerae]